MASRVRVLLVEDDTTLQRFVAMALEDDEVRLQACISVDEALLALATQSFDLVISDLMLPGRHGLDLLQTLKQRPEPARHGAAGRVQRRTQPGRARTAGGARRDAFPVQALLAGGSAILPGRPARRDAGGGDAVDPPGGHRTVLRRQRRAVPGLPRALPDAVPARHRQRAPRLRTRRTRQAAPSRAQPEERAADAGAHRGGRGRPAAWSSTRNRPRRGPRTPSPPRAPPGRCWKKRSRACSESAAIGLP